MKVRYEETVVREVTLTDKQCSDIDKERVRKVLGLGDWYLMDGFVCRDEEYYGSHYKCVTEKIREATEEDKIIFDLLSKL